MAYELATAGKTVVVIDAETPGGGETGRTTSHLMTAFDDRYFNVERHLGAEAARLVAQSHTAAIARIEAICLGESIACEFERVDGYLFAESRDAEDVLGKELAATHRAGLTEVAWLDSVPTGATALGPALHFPRQGQLHPLKYLEGLLGAIERHGGKVYGKTRALEVEDGNPVTVRTAAAGPSIKADSVIVATNTPFNDRFAIHTKQAGYRTFVIGMKVRRGSMPNCQFWDTVDPYHYVRIAGDLDDTHQLLISGGEDHKVGQANDAGQRFDRLTAWTRQRFPVVEEPVFAWSGQVMEPVDSLAFIGRNPGQSNVYVVTGDSGNGMTHGAIAGLLIRGLLIDGGSEWASLYDPARKSLSAAFEYARENVNVAVQYADWLGKDQALAPDALPAGEGAVVKAGGRHMAVSRDANGQLWTFDAACPHLMCLVQWNRLEKSFDCPCHGSRFRYDGTVLHGPARDGLRPVPISGNKNSSS